MPPKEKVERSGLYSAAGERVHFRVEARFVLFCLPKPFVVRSTAPHPSELDPLSVA